jgi:gas vesicle protein
LQDIAGQMTAQCEASLTELAAVGEGVVQLFTEVQGAASSVQGRTAETTDGLLQELEELMADATGEWAESAETAISDFSSEVDGTLRQTLQTNMDEAGQQLKEGFTTFSSTSEEHVQELISTLSGSAEGTVDTLRDTISSEVQSACDDVINDLVATFAENVQADFLAMQIGAQVTGTLSPILPQLKVAETVLSAFNSIVDMVD